MEISPSFLWSLTRDVDNVDVQLPAGVATARDLVLPPTAEYILGGVRSIGVPAGVYRAQLQAFDAAACADADNVVCAQNGLGLTPSARRLQASTATSATVIGFASVRVEVNAPPQGGAVQASPRTGVSASTRFAFTASGFVDPHAPLTYEFWSEPIGATGAAQRTFLATASEQSTLRGVILPEGQLRIGCTATDAHGASADATFSSMAMTTSTTSTTHAQHLDSTQPRPLM